MMTNEELRQRLVRKRQRECPECGRLVWYGIYCSNVCSDVADKRWERKRK